MMTTLMLLSAFQTVNARPQLAIVDDAFSFYWAVWRGLTPDETPRLREAGGGSLLTERAIDWSTVDCDSGAENHDGERMWYLDRLRFDESGEIVPLREAVRPGFRYLTLINLNGVLLRGREIRSPKGARGTVNVESAHRLFTRKIEDPFNELEDYRLKRAPLYAVFEKYSPYHWPVFYDERAHKPHRLTPPPSWESTDFIAEHRFRARLDWNWCGDRLAATFHVPPGGMPPPGPTRAGRPEAGTTEIRVVEDL